MNTFVCALVLLAAAATAAGLPRHRRPGTEGAPRDPRGAEDAPYPPAGFRPAKSFELPTREDLSPPSTTYGVPASSYGAPLNTYVAPQTTYGPPESDGGDRAADRDVESLEGVQKNNEKNEKLEEGPKNDAEVVSARGAYYVLLPDGQLQRVRYHTQSEPGRAAYTARLQYSSGERAPLYLYGAATYVQLV